MQEIARTKEAVPSVEVIEKLAESLEKILDYYCDPNTRFADEDEERVLEHANRALITAKTFRATVG